MDWERTGAAIREHFGDPIPLESLPFESQLKEKERRRWEESTRWFGADYDSGYYHPFMSSTGMEGRCDVCGLADSQLHTDKPWYARLAPGASPEPIPEDWDREAAIARYSVPIEE